MISIVFQVASLMQFFTLNFSDPKFEAQLIDGNISIGYGVAIGDVDGDEKPDILLADKKQFVWYRNGDWKRFVMVENLTEADNVCIAARDIDGDGKVEVAVGAQWNPGETSDTLKSGSVHYLMRPDDPVKPWKPVRLHHEPTVHRMRWVSVGENKFHLVVVPLHGRGNKNGEGQGVRIIAYEMPADPAGKWEHTIIDQSMHMTHNFDVKPSGLPGKTNEWIYVGGREGIKILRNTDGNWENEGKFLVKGTGFGEVRIADGQTFAGISPMHGNELVIHDNLAKTILTSDLNQGHALAVDDLLSMERKQIVVGWREPNKENKVGIKIFVPEEGTSPTWKTFWIDENGMACEDLLIADLDGDGKNDIIAAGRATHNLKIYWNRSR